jgi:hypothetical protein
VRRACAGLIHVDDELVAERTAEDLVRRAGDGVANPFFETSERDVRAGRRFLDENRRVNQRARRTQAADREVLDGTRRLNTVIRVGRNGALAKRIALETGAHG